MAMDGGIDIGDELVDDGTNFIGIVPTFISPNYLTLFRLYEKLEVSGEKGVYRFRCLFKDTASIPETTLSRMLSAWDCLYIHKRDMGHYDKYLKDNLHIILANQGIEMDKRIMLFTEICFELIQGVMAKHFGLPRSSTETCNKLKALMFESIGVITDLDFLKELAALIGHDYDTCTHSIKVGWLMAVFVNANPDLFDVSGKSELEKLVVEVAVMGFLHDIGKSKIPRHIINKKGRLSNIEYVAAQAHTAYSLGLLFELNLPRHVMDGILYHHENEDGSGYPCGFKGNKIPLFAKLCHIADVFDALALSPELPYKTPKTPYQALMVMAGKNPNLDALQQMEKEVAEISDLPFAGGTENPETPDLKVLEHEFRMNREAQKRVEVRMRLRDKGMAHCFDTDLLKRFVITLNRSRSFELSALFRKK
ncbi:MAG: HD domain-containing protein [Desulfobacteraceae bacterium]|nr:HD domain-containing protein [Desulfobacteraceae bacterium]